MRKAPHRASTRRPRGHVTTDQVLTWLDARLANDPVLRRSVKHVLAALRKAEAVGRRRRRRAG
jgi:hypothetical protein